MALGESQNAIRVWCISQGFTGIETEKGAGALSDTWCGCTNSVPNAKGEASSDPACGGSTDMSVRRHLSLNGSSRLELETFISNKHYIHLIWKNIFSFYVICKRLWLYSWVEAPWETHLYLVQCTSYIYKQHHKTMSSQHRGGTWDITVLLQHFSSTDVGPAVHPWGPAGHVCTVYPQGPARKPSILDEATVLSLPGLRSQRLSRNHSHAVRCHHKFMVPNLRTPLALPDHPSFLGLPASTAVNNSKSCVGLVLF